MTEAEGVLRACQAAVGSQVGSGVLWGHSGPLGTARDRSASLGLARGRGWDICGPPPAGWAARLGGAEVLQCEKKL